MKKLFLPLWLLTVLPVFGCEHGNKTVPTEKQKVYVATVAAGVAVAADKEKSQELNKETKMASENKSPAQELPEPPTRWGGYGDPTEPNGYGWPNSNI